MAILIDLIVIGIFLLSIFLGYKRGLIGAAFKILSFLIAIIITLLLYKPVAGYIIHNTNIDDTIQNTIVEKLSSTKIEEGEKIQKQDTNLPNVMIDYINQGIEDTVNQAKNNVVEILAVNLTENIINILSIVGLFIITKILLLFAKVVLQAVAELPIIKQFNEVGGIAYGILRGILLIYVILAIISLLAPMIENTIVIKSINQTILTKILYNNNLILMLFF